MNTTIDWYSKHAKEYAEKTRGIPMGFFHGSFLSLVGPAPKRVLDIGPGSGRDMFAFGKLGYDVEGIDPCSELGAIASEYSNFPVRTMRAQDLDDRDEWHGIWACSSLCHVPAEDTPIVLDRIRQALRDGGALYTCYPGLSDPQPKGDGRFFQRTNQWMLRQTLENAGLTPVSVWNSNTGKPGSSTQWVNALAIKK